MTVGELMKIMAEIEVQTERRARLSNALENVRSDEKDFHERVITIKDAIQLIDQQVKQLKNRELGS